MAGVMDGLEPGAETGKTTDGRGGERYLTAGEIFQLSQAISLKRIADNLDRVIAGNARPAIRTWESNK